MFGSLYVLLQLEQTALVLGALLLFTVLAAVMTITRRVDWYVLGAQLRETASRAATVEHNSESAEPVR